MDPPDQNQYIVTLIKEKKSYVLNIQSARNTQHCEMNKPVPWENMFSEGFLLNSRQTTHSSLSELTEGSEDNKDQKEKMGMKRIGLRKEL